MIFFINNSGTIIHDLPEQVYQGSANANSIYVVAPFARNLTATVAFGLPNGVFTKPSNLSYTGEITGFTDEQGTSYYGWSYEIPNDITALYGTVIAQFTFYSGGRMLATSSTTFTVGRGIPPIMPETPTEDIYEQILQLISSIQQDLGNGYYSARAVYAWNSTYKYGANELVYYPTGKYGVYVKSLVADNTQQPYINGVIGSNWRLVVDFNDIMNAQAEIAESASKAAQSATEAATSASSASNSANSSAQSAAKALNNAKAAQSAASSASNSASSAAASATEVREALGNYYTKIEIDGSVAKTLEVAIDNFTYEMDFVLKSANGTVLSSNRIDLPLESVVVSGRYDTATKTIILTLQNGQTVRIPIGDLIEGLASQEALDDVIDGTTPVAKAVRADTSANADNAEKVTNSLTIITDGVPTEYNGGTAREVVINTTSNTDPESVHFTPQNLTADQQAQARANIDAQVVGDYALKDEVPSTSDDLNKIAAYGYVMSDSKVIDATGLDENKWYPVTVELRYNRGETNDSNIRIEVYAFLYDGDVPSWSTHVAGFSCSKIWETNAGGWGANEVCRRILASEYAFTSSHPVRNIDQFTENSNEFFYVRGGGKYKFHSSYETNPVLHAEGCSWTTEHYNKFLRVLDTEPEDSPITIVETNGDQTIRGKKTFTDPLYVSAIWNRGGYPIIETKNENTWAAGVRLSSHGYTAICAGEPTEDFREVEDVVIEANNQIDFYSGSDAAVNKKHVQIDANGNLNVIDGHILERGQRVYSPNNLPTQMIAKGGSNPVFALPFVMYENIEPNHDSVNYFKELLKWICRNYPNVKGGLWIGRADPNSAGQVIIDIYDTNKVNDEGVPQYSTGVFRSINNNTVVFHTNNYIYGWKSFDDYYYSEDNKPTPEDIGALAKSNAKSYVFGNYYTVLDETALTSDSQTVTIQNGKWDDYSAFIFMARNSNSGTSDTDYSVVFVPNAIFSNICTSSTSTLTISREGARLKIYKSSNTSFTVVARNYNNRIRIYGLKDA